MKDERSLEEIKDSLMEWPKAVTKALDGHTKTLGHMAELQELLLELVCRLHKIDLEEMRAEFALGGKQ